MHLSCLKNHIDDWLETKDTILPLCPVYRKDINLAAMQLHHNLLDDMDCQSFMKARNYHLAEILDEKAQQVAQAILKESTISITNVISMNLTPEIASLALLRELQDSLNTIRKEQFENKLLNIDTEISNHENNFNIAIAECYSLWETMEDSTMLPAHTALKKSLEHQHNLFLTRLCRDIIQQKFDLFSDELLEGTPRNHRLTELRRILYGAIVLYNS